MRMGSSSTMPKRSRTPEQLSRHDRALVVFDLAGLVTLDRYIMYVYFNFWVFFGSDEQSPPAVADAAP